MRHFQPPRAALKEDKRHGGGGQRLEWSGSTQQQPAWGEETRKERVQAKQGQTRTPGKYGTRPSIPSIPPIWFSVSTLESTSQQTVPPLLSASTTTRRERFTFQPSSCLSGRASRGAKSPQRKPGVAAIISTDWQQLICLLKSPTHLPLLIEHIWMPGAYADLPRPQARLDCTSYLCYSSRRSTHDPLFPGNFQSPGAAIVRIHECSPGVGLDASYPSSGSIFDIPLLALEIHTLSLCLVGVDTRLYFTTGQSPPPDLLAAQARWDTEYLANLLNKDFPQLKVDHSNAQLSLIYSWSERCGHLEDFEPTIAVIDINTSVHLAIAKRTPSSVNQPWRYHTFTLVNTESAEKLKARSPRSGLVAPARRSDVNSRRRKSFSTRAFNEVNRDDHKYEGTTKASLFTVLDQMCLSGGALRSSVPIGIREAGESLIYGLPGIGILGLGSWGSVSRSLACTQEVTFLSTFCVGRDVQAYDDCNCLTNSSTCFRFPITPFGSSRIDPTVTHLGGMRLRYWHRLGVERRLKAFCTWL
ncbi:hypothetical protein NMY22_g17220 [Coprinellus aureogranulatus]|nr:hypothetical protein NMY22_g17220 [Coprinellus aureogranulatus]